MADHDSKTSHENPDCPEPNMEELSEDDLEGVSGGWTNDPSDG